MASSDNNKAAADTKERYTFFWRSESPFSQWHPCKFRVEGVEYNCAEQYMMHQKAVLFGDKAMAAKIMATNSPKDQKAYGRKVSNFDANIWDDRCRDIVKKGNLAKFGQNEELWKAMSVTEGTVLVEASPRDRLWGIGLGANNPKALNKMTWRGKNWLGYVLTQVRTELLQTKDGAVGGNGAVEGASGTSTQTDSNPDEQLGQMNKSNLETEEACKEKREHSNNSRKGSGKSKKKLKS